MKVIIDLSTRELAELTKMSQSTLMRTVKKTDLVHLWFSGGSLVVQNRNATILKSANQLTDLVQQWFSSGSLMVQQEENSLPSPTTPTTLKEEVPPIIEKNIIINNTKKEVPPKSQAKRVDDLSQYEWADDNLRETLQEWVDYKRKRGQTYNTVMGLKKLHTQVMKWSGGNPEVLREMINYSMVNNYQGLFEPKEKKSNDQIGVVLRQQPKTKEEYGFDW